MIPSLHLAAVAAAYLLWLSSYLVLGRAAFGAEHYYWAEGSVVAVTLLLAARVARTVERPYSLFFLALAAAFSMLVVTSTTYGHTPPWQAPGFDPADAPEIWAVAYASFLFLWICAWGYLAVEQWRDRPPSALTAVVFAVLGAGLAAISLSFYSEAYAGNLASVQGRLDAVIAGLEFSAVVVALASVLLGVPTAMTWMVFAMAMLAASDMLYTESTGYSMANELAWMTGLFLLLAGVVAFPGEPRRRIVVASGSAVGNPGAEQRSGLSGALLLLSVGTLLLASAVAQLPDSHAESAEARSIVEAWQAFLSVLFVVALVLTLVWLTDRFDETVSYLRLYTTRLHRNRLRGSPWREAPPRLRGTLLATGLGAYLDALCQSARRLGENVLFLGPERLFRPVKASQDGHPPRCFIVMPFSLEWSGDVHRTLSAACRAAGVLPVRGDDLFTPTDILEDIWQGINGADFLIADITGRNPNVFYELGIAHTLAKPVLIISRAAEDIPVDLSSRRVIVYGGSTGDWREDLRHKADTAIAEILRSYAPRPTAAPRADGTGEEDAGSDFPPAAPPVPAWQKAAQQSSDSP